MAWESPHAKSEIPTVQTRHHPNSKSLRLILAGAKGAVGSTVAVVLAVLRKDPQAVLSSLTTAKMFPYLGFPQAMELAGWEGLSSLRPIFEETGISLETE